MTCNGSGLRETSLKDRVLEAEDSASSARRKSDVEKWAALLAASAMQAQSAVTTLGHVPEGWRGDVEGMTPVEGNDARATATGQSQSVQGPPFDGAETSADGERVQVRVSIGELGELALVLERSTEGVKVQISAQDRGILAMMASEQDALTAALSGVGHCITSLSFVPMDRVGIKLAQPRVASQSTRLPGDTSHAANQTAQARRKSRGLNVIG